MDSKIDGKGGLDVSEPLVEGSASHSSSSPDVSKESPREISAATIGRMMGLATVSEVKLLEGKMDLLSTKISAITAKLDRLIATANHFPTGSDLERIDVQIGSLKNLLKEGFVDSKEPSSAAAAPAAASSAPADAAAPRKPRPNVFVSKPAEDPAAEGK
jgi:hypothetical protein